MAGAPAAILDQEVTLKVSIITKWQSRKTKTAWVPDDTSPKELQTAYCIWEENKTFNLFNKFFFSVCVFIKSNIHIWIQFLI